MTAIAKTNGKAKAKPIFIIPSVVTRYFLRELLPKETIDGTRAEN